MTFTTRSGSRYELDRENNRIRRLFGPRDATPRQGEDGAWKEVVSVSDVLVGHKVLISWRVNDNGVVEGTLTSPVTAIGEVLN